MSYLGQQLGQGQAERFIYTATGGETSVTSDDLGRAIAYTVGQVDVYLNGAKLINGSDFTATTGTSITGLAALTASDVVEVFALSIFQASDTVSAASGGTFNGNVTVDAALSVTGTTTITTADINGGTIDGVTIGGSTPAAISGTTGSFSGNLTVDTNTLFVDAANNAVGIGTTSIDLTSAGRTVVQVEGSSNALLNLTDGTSRLYLHQKGGTSGADIWNSANSYMRFATNDTERMRIDASGNLGLGVTPGSFDSGYRALQIGTTANFMGAVSGDGNWISNNAIFSDGVWNYIQTAAASSLDMQSGTAPFRFRYAASGTAGNAISWSEAMRIDSSGNLLVGTTNAVPLSDDGAVLGASGYVYASRDGDIALFANRLTSDGDIAVFRKDGTTVGSIQSRAGLVSTIILDPRSGSLGTGLTGSGANLSPTNGSGTEVDARNDIGTATYRFKDLYLSGGVYLGGTGAANLLDDYEEGTFTPADNNIGAYTNSYGRYTKVGNLVHCFGYFTVQSNSNSNGADLTMPFTYGFSAQTATIGTVLTNEAGSYYLKSTSNTLLTIVDEDEVVQTLADFSTKTVHFNVTFHVA